MGVAAITKAGCIYENGLKGESLDIGVLLSWSTTNETDNSLFIIEKSGNGLKFEASGSIDGAGTSMTPKKYSFLDIRAGSGSTYYRLKQVDYDGSYQYSEILEVRTTRENQFIVADMSSEMTSTTFDMTIEAKVITPLNCQLRDARGEVVREQFLTLSQGLNTISLDLSDQSEGLYRLALMAGNEEEVLTVRRVLDATERASNVATNKKPEVKKN